MLCHSVKKRDLRRSVLGRECGFPLAAVRLLLQGYHMSNHKKAFKCRRCPDRRRLNSSLLPPRKTARGSCDHLGCLIMILAACHACACPGANLLLRYCVIRRLTASLLGTWAVALPAFEWGVLLGVVVARFTARRPSP